MRVVSLLPAATELVCALDQGHTLVGRSHECDRPVWVQRLPILSGPTFDVTGSSGDIDRLVRETLGAGRPLYSVDILRLRALSPDLVITQVHCDVCAVGPEVVADPHVLPGLESLRTVSMKGGSLEGILMDFQLVADALGCAREGRALVATVRGEVEKWRVRTAPLSRPRVVCLEWTDPPFPMGNWGPELIELAGGECVLGNRHAHSAAVPWDAVVDADPDVLIVAPCGFGLQRALAEAAVLAARPGWSALKAVRNDRVFVSDGNIYFNRSGPSAFGTIPLLAEMIHPSSFAARHLGTVYQRWFPGLC